MEFVLPLPNSLHSHGSSRQCWHKLQDRLTNYCSGLTSEANTSSSLLHLIAGQGVTQVFGQHFPDILDGEKIRFLQDLEEQCLPKFILLLERFRFFTLGQRRAEKVSKFLFNLEFLADLCEFEEAQDDLVRDQLVSGISCKNLQGQLKSVENLTKKTAKVMCRKFRHCTKVCCRGSATKRAVSLSPPPPSSDIENCDVADSPVSSPEVVVPLRQLRSAAKKTKVLKKSLASNKKKSHPVVAAAKKKKKKKASAEASPPPMPTDMQVPLLKDTTLDLSHLQDNDKLIRLYDQLTGHLEILADFDAQGGERAADRCMSSSVQLGDRELDSVLASRGVDEGILSLVEDVEGEDLEDTTDSQDFDVTVGDGSDAITLDMGTHLNFSEKLSRMFGAKDELRETLIVTKKLDPSAQSLTEEEYDSNFFQTLRNHVIPERRKKNVDECAFCDLILPVKKHMLRHLHQAHPDRFPHKCGQCPAMYMRPRNLSKHVKAAHSKRGVEKAVCEQCGSVFSDAGKLTKHIYRVHTIGKAFECEICHKRLASKDGLTYHLRVHRSERPFVCHVCGAEHANQGNLKRHIKWRHQGVKPHKCPDCGKAFIQLAQKVLHVRRYHTKETPFQCKECGSKFYSKYDLKVHTRKHTGERPYHCDICGKDFRVGIQLNRHLQTHTGQKSFPCDLCESKFSRLSNLRSHKRTVHAQTAEAAPSTAAAPVLAPPPQPPAQVYAPQQGDGGVRMAAMFAAAPPMQMDQRPAMYAHAAQMEHPPREPVFPPHPQMEMAGFPRPPPHHYDQQMARPAAASPHGQLENRPPVFPYSDPQQWNRPVWLQPL